MSRYLAIVASEPAFLALRFAGAAYLLYLGARLLFAPKDRLLPTGTSPRPRPGAWGFPPRVPL